MESRYFHTVPDGKSVCPERPRRKVPMSRFFCVHQTFVLSPDFCAFTSRFFCLHPTFVRSTDFCAFMSKISCIQWLPCVHVQTFVRSPDLFAFRSFCAFMSGLSCVHQTFRAFMSRHTWVQQTFRAFICRLSCVQQAFRAFMSRLSCVQQTFRAFMSRLSCVQQTFRAFICRLSCVFLVSRLCKFERTTPQSCVYLGLEISVLDLRLGSFRSEIKKYFVLSRFGEETFCFTREIFLKGICLVFKISSFFEKQVTHFIEHRIQAIVNNSFHFQVLIWSRHRFMSSFKKSHYYYNYFLRSHKKTSFCCISIIKYIKWYDWFCTGLI